MNTIKRLRCRLLVLLTHNLALPLLKHLRKPKPFPLTLQQLCDLEKGTLGNDLYHFIENKNLVLLTHYARHDMKHIVLDYDTTEEGELCLQSFMLGNGRVSFPVLATVIFGMLTAPEYWKKMLYAYKAGKSRIPIHDWDWFTLIDKPTDEIKQSIVEKR